MNAVQLDLSKVQVGMLFSGAPLMEYLSPEPVLYECTFNQDGTAYFRATYHGVKIGQAGYTVKDGWVWVLP